MAANTPYRSRAVDKAGSTSAVRASLAKIPSIITSFIHSVRLSIMSSKLTADFLLSRILGEPP